MIKIWQRDLSQICIYRALTDPDISFVDRFKAIKLSAKKIIGVAALATVTVVIAVQGVKLLLHLTTKIALIKAVSVASMTFGVLGLGLDAIIGAILGAIERDKLNDAIDDLEKVLEKFKPAAEAYNHSIVKVEVFIEFYRTGIV